MKPAEALHYENYGGQATVPALYSDMPCEMLEALAKEWARPSAAARVSAMLDALTQQPRRKFGAAAPADPAPADPVPAEPPFKEPEIVGEYTKRGRMRASLSPGAGRCRGAAGGEAARGGGRLRGARAGRGRAAAFRNVRFCGTSGHAPVRLIVEQRQ